MKRGFLKDANAGMQFLFTALIFIASWIIFQLFSLLSGMFIFEMTMDELMQSMMAMQDPESIALMKYVQAFTSIGMFAGASLITAYYISDSAIHYLRLHKLAGWMVSIMVSFLIIFTLPMNNYLTWLNGELQLPEGVNWLQDYFERKEGEMERIMNRFLEVDDPAGLFVNIIVIALIPAVGEELFFRGIIQRIFLNGLKNVHLAVILASFIFGILHFQFLSFLPRFVLGIILGYIFVWTKTIWMPILAHFINNGLAVIFYYYYLSGKTNDQLEQMGTPGNDAAYALLSFMIVLILMLAIRRTTKEERLN